MVAGRRQTRIGAELRTAGPAPVQVQTHRNSSVITTVDSARDLGVTLDSHLTMSAHASSMCRSAYCFLRQLRPVVRSLTEDEAKTVVHAFISMRLDYCNSLLCKISDTLLRRLQSVQNAAARVITRTPKRQRVAFKLAVLVYKALNNRAPEYLSQDCRLVDDTGRRELRSSYNYTCASVTTSTRFGDGAFAAAGPRLWNSLPADVRRTDFTVETFCRKLKTYLFDRDAST